MTRSGDLALLAGRARQRRQLGEQRQDISGPGRRHRLILGGEGGFRASLRPRALELLAARELVLRTAPERTAAKARKHAVNHASGSVEQPPLAAMFVVEQ